MIRRLLLVTALLAVVVPAAPAAAKGAAGVTITGYGFRVSLDMDDPRLLELSEQAHLFWVIGAPEVGLLAESPVDALGPGYVLDWDLGGAALRQFAYPLASVVYVLPGQRTWDRELPGGWFEVDAGLLRTLNALGANLPADEAEAASAAPTTPADLAAAPVPPTEEVTAVDRPLWWYLVPSALLAAIAAAVLRRRTDHSVA